MEKFQENDDRGKGNIKESAVMHGLRRHKLLIRDRNGNRSTEGSDISGVEMEVETWRK